MCVCLSVCLFSLSLSPPPFGCPAGEGNVCCLVLSFPVLFCPVLSCLRHTWYFVSKRDLPCNSVFVCVSVCVCLCARELARGILCLRAILLARILFCIASRRLSRRTPADPLHAKPALLTNSLYCRGRAAHHDSIATQAAVHKGHTKRK